MIHGIWGRFARNAVDDFENFGKRTTLRLCTRPTRQSFGDAIEVGHVAHDIGAEHGIANRVERNPRPFRFDERGLFRRNACDDVAQRVRCRVAANVVPQKIVFRTTLAGFLGRALVGQAAEDQDRDPGCGLEQLIEGLDALAVGQKQVEQDDRYATRLQPLQTLGEQLDPFDVVRSRSRIGESLDKRLRLGRIIVFLRRGPPFRARLNARDWVFRSRRGDEKCPQARLWAQVWRDGVSTGHGRRL
jgi:hypothetical protein